MHGRDSRVPASQTCCVPAASDRIILSRLDLIFFPDFLGRSLFVNPTTPGRGGAAARRAGDIGSGLHAGSTDWAMCIGCNSAAALLIWSTFLANQLRECAICPGPAIGTIGQSGKNGPDRSCGTIRPSRPAARRRSAGSGQPAACPLRARASGSPSSQGQGALANGHRKRQ